MCISWSNGGDYSREDSPLESLGCLPYFVASLGIKKIPSYRVSLRDLVEYPRLDLVCSYFNFMSLCLMLCSEFILIAR
jgi:hypothetical protein